MFEKSRYDIEYAKANIKRIHIPFNMTNEDDRALLEWVQSKPNMTAYIKNLIRENMGKDSDS